MSACGTRMLHELSPKTRTDSAITHSEAGGLSTVMRFAASEEPNRNAVQSCAARLHGCGVERVGPPRGGQAPEVEHRGQRRAAERRGAHPRWVVARPRQSRVRARSPEGCGRPAASRTGRRGGRGAEPAGAVASGSTGNGGTNGVSGVRAVIGDPHVGPDGYGSLMVGHRCRARRRRPTSGRAGSAGASRRGWRARAPSPRRRGRRPGRARAAAPASLVRARPTPSTTRPCSLVADAVGAPADSEGVPAVDRGVADRGQQQRRGVGPLRAHGAAEQQEQREVGQRREHADHRETQQLRAAGRRPVRRRAHRRGAPAARCAPRPERVPGARCRGGPPLRWRRCRRASRGRRPSRPAPRGCACPSARRARAARCRRTSSGPRRAGSSSRARSARIALNPHCASENRVASVVRRSRL